MDPDEAPVITIGLDHPGYSTDLSTWLIEVYEDGALSWTLRECHEGNDFLEQMIQKKGKISLGDLEQILEQSHRLGFWEMPSRLEAQSVNCETVSISIRTGTKIKTVEVYDPLSLPVQKCDRYIWSFVALWQQIARHAPDPVKYNLTLKAMEYAAETHEEREAKKKKAFEDAAAARGVMDVKTIKNGFVRCPHCKIHFPLYSNRSWTGSRHESCGTWLRLPVSIEGLKTREDFRGFIVRDGVKQRPRLRLRA